jgi:hypothetical protein
MATSRRQESMSTPRVGRPLHTDKGTPIRHIASHAHLLQNALEAPALTGRSRPGRPDAIIVPSARPASALSGIIDLAASVECEIVVICSQQAKVDQVAERIRRVPGARGLVVQVDEHYLLPVTPFATSSPTLIGISNGRASDLSVKRNVGLLLARLAGWRKIIFVDDDIYLSRASVARLADQLDSNPIAGMMCRDFPDNSVFCHARRLAKLSQDVFVTGAVLGVNCSDLPLPFFPDIYNEDWFFFSEAAAHHRLAQAGEARQATYNPYEKPTRASHEEFGDLLAEGLYSLLASQYPSISNWRPGTFFSEIAKLATEKYWSSFVEARRKDLAETRSRLQEFTERDNCSDDVRAAIASLGAADARYDDNQSNAITASRCAEFVEAWRGDVMSWNMIYPHINNLRNVRDAIAWLEPAAWEKVR